MTSSYLRKLLTADESWSSYSSTSSNNYLATSSYSSTSSNNYLATSSDSSTSSNNYLATSLDSLLQELSPSFYPNQYPSYDNFGPYPLYNEHQDPKAFTPMSYTSSNMNNFFEFNSYTPDTGFNSGFDYSTNHYIQSEMRTPSQETYQKNLVSNGEIYKEFTQPSYNNFTVYPLNGEKPALSNGNTYPYETAIHTETGVGEMGTNTQSNVHESETDTSTDQHREIGTNTEFYRRSETRKEQESSNSFPENTEKIESNFNSPIQEKTEGSTVKINIKTIKNCKIINGSYKKYSGKMRKSKKYSARKRGKRSR